MRRLSISLCLACLALSSCGPSRYVMDLEMRTVSKSGVDLNGKLISVVYLDDGREVSTNFSRGMASGFSSSIEKAYGIPEGTIGLYRMPLDKGSDYASRDTLFNILMDTGVDVVFMFDTVRFGSMTVSAPAKIASTSSADSAYLSTCSIPFSMKLFCYDGMNQDDKVRTFTGSSSASPDIYSDGGQSREVLKQKAFDALESEAVSSGNTISDSFSPQWKTEQFTLFYFDNENWYSAIEKAAGFDWKGATEIWIAMISSRDPLKRSCAAYNIATVCHIIGNDNLAREWLDRSDADNPLDASSTLRARLKN